MADPEKEKQNLTMAEINPKRLLKGEIPRLIDEWQIAPKLWDAVRFEVDHRNEFGQFILTGSSVPASYEQYSSYWNGSFFMAADASDELYESLDSTGKVSLKILFEAPEQIEGENALDL